MVIKPVLRKWDPELEIKTETNVFNGVIGGALMQRQKDRKWHPIAYFIKTITENKVNYGIKNKELLAQIFSFIIIRFSCLWNNAFIITLFRPRHYL